MAGRPTDTRPRFRRAFLATWALSLFSAQTTTSWAARAHGNGWEELRAGIQSRAAGGFDLTQSPPASGETKPLWAARPSGRFAEWRAEDPSVRVSAPPSVALKDLDLDGLPDRVARALNLTARVSALLRSLGFAAIADDGDGEIDLYLLPLEGAAPSVVAFEQRQPPGRGASGFAMIDVSTRQRDEAFDAAIVRSVARLAFGALDVDAPEWWTEASLQWVQRSVLGTGAEQDRAVQVRWNHPERGIDASDPLLAQGNVTLLRGLQDEGRAWRLLQAAWKQLATRREADPASSVIEASVMASTGHRLAELVLRAGIAELVDGLQPSRFALSVGALPVFEQDCALPVAPTGAAIIPITPDPVEPYATRLALVFGDEHWTGALVAHRIVGGWDRIPLAIDGDHTREVVVPWGDYDRAFALVVREPDAGGPGSVRVRARGQGQTGLAAWSSVGAQPVGFGMAEIRWSSAWEQELRGWVIERAPALNGPWQIVTPLPVPAVGQLHSETQYVAHDALPAEWRRIFYRVVGVTPEGLRLTGPTIALRAESD